MEPGEALSTAAQIAVALAGFAGVVVVFRTGSVHDWSRADKFRLRLLLSNSVAPLSFCMLGMLLLSVQPRPEWIWRACSGFATASLFPFALITARHMRAFPPTEFQLSRGSKFLFYSMGVVGTAAYLLQVLNAVLLNVFWAFFTTIVVQLLAGMFQFVRLILLPPEDESHD